MERIYLLSPAIALFGLLLTTFLVYCGLCATGNPPEVKGVKHNQLFGFFMARYLLWFLSPVEKLLVGRVSPNAITTASLLMCVGSGVAVGLGHLAICVWLFVGAGILDILDGRLARLANAQTKSGALFDSVSDRWGELFVLTGYVWYLRDTAWLLAVMGALAGSMMVSYTRARAEGLKVELTGGLMQRAERIVLIAGGTLIAAWYGATPAQADLVGPILGGTMTICAVASTATALNRWLVAFRELAKREAKVEVEVVAKVVTPAVPLDDSAPQPIFVPKALRESAEMGL